MRIADHIGGALTSTIERYVNYRRTKKARQRNKRSQSQIVEWAKAFLWAVGMVLLINQYLLQAYHIPSGSMRNTLLEGDRIFVGKFIFGPELLPGAFKIGGLKKPQYGNVVIFENPTYISRGILYTILQRVLYMATLSVVNLERGVQGEHQIQLLIKRQIGTAHQQIRLEKGEAYFKAFNAKNWISEEEYMRNQGQHYQTRRLVDSDSYDYADRAVIALQKQELGQSLTELEIEAFAVINAQQFFDRYYFENARSYAQLTAHPNELFRLYREQRHRNGWYVPSGYFLPLGDNRDNSRDGRYYGLVGTDEVLGKARLRYWPLKRVGLVK